MNTQTTTNSLVHSASKTYNNELSRIDVKIRLNDQCKNGHQDFSIVCDLYERRNKAGRFSDVGGGAAHDIILEHFPEFKPFVDLHLSDYLGAPMYAEANGFYHLKNTSVNACKDYIRASTEQMKAVVLAEDSQHFKFILENLGLIDQWKAEAKAAIKELENLTGKNFVVDSKRSQYTPLTEQEFAAMQTKVREGYYHPEEIAQRAQEAKEAATQKAFDKLAAEKDEAINKEHAEYAVKYYVLKAGLPLDSCIYYDHKNTLCFNWNISSFRHYVTKQEFAAFEALQFGALKELFHDTLPEGITFECKEK